MRLFITMILIILTLSASCIWTLNYFYKIYNIFHKKNISRDFFLIKKKSGYKKLLKFFLFC